VTRRAFIGTLAGGLLAAPLAAEAQPAGKIRHVGVLVTSSTPDLDDAFRKGLRELGWIEGQNIALEYRNSEGRPERLLDMAADLVRINVDVIVAPAAPEAEAAKRATRTIPIVFLVHGDPVGSGLVATLAHPGGNMTGLGQMLPELAAKQLEFLRHAVPGISRVAVLWNATSRIKRLDMGALQRAAPALRVTLQSREVRGLDDFDGVFTATKGERPDALLTLVDPVTFAQRHRITEFAARERLPAMYAVREFVEAGGLMSYGVDLRDLFRRGATYVDKILKETKPADLPVEQPTKFALIINLKAAKALGLTLPPSLLQRADQVIE
jgi:putative ABC transport system substrate-binding protein